MKRTKTNREKIQAVLNEAEEKCSLQEMPLERASCGDWPAPETDSDFLAWWLDEIHVQKDQLSSHPKESDPKPCIQTLQKYSARLQELGVKPSRLPWEAPGLRKSSPFRVNWEIDIEADNPRQAALKALKIQRDRNSIATVFEVKGRRIDLGKDGPQEVAITRRKGGRKQRPEESTEPIRRSRVTELKGQVQRNKEEVKKMPKCPNCDKKITHVLRCEMANVVSVMYLDEAGELRLREQSFEPEVVEFLCPECNQKLFDSSEEAENFLKELSLESVEAAIPNHP